MTNKYLLSLNTGASYELGGETPNANFSPASDQVMPCYLTSGLMRSRLPPSSRSFG